MPGTESVQETVAGKSSFFLSLTLMSYDCVTGRNARRLKEEDARRIAGFGSHTVESELKMMTPGFSLSIG